MPWLSYKEVTADQQLLCRVLKNVVGKAAHSTLPLERARIVHDCFADVGRVQEQRWQFLCLTEVLLRKRYGTTTCHTVRRSQLRREMRRKPLQPQSKAYYYHHHHHYYYIISHSVHSSSVSEGTTPKRRSVGVLDLEHWEFSLPRLLSGRAAQGPGDFGSNTAKSSTAGIGVALGRLARLPKYRCARPKSVTTPGRGTPGERRGSCAGDPYARSRSSMEPIEVLH